MELDLLNLDMVLMLEWDMEVGLAFLVLVDMELDHIWFHRHLDHMDMAHMLDMVQMLDMDILIIN